MVGATRNAAALLLAAGFLLVLASSAAAQADDSRSILSAVDSVEAPTIARINAVRSEQGLRPLRVSASLAQAAEAHSVSMARGGFFSHDSSDGTQFWKRIAHYYGSRGYLRWVVGENLLWASPAVTPARAVEMWLDSPGHRKILLGSAWTQIGLAAVHVTDAPGVFGGLDVTLITADFGSRG